MTAYTISGRSTLVHGRQGSLMPLPLLSLLLHAAAAAADAATVVGIVFSRSAIRQLRGKADVVNGDKYGR